MSGLDWTGCEILIGGEKLIPGLGLSELVVILLTVLVTFGVGKLLQIGPDLGEAPRGFKDALQGTDAVHGASQKKVKAKTAEDDQ